MTEERKQRSFQVERIEFPSKKPSKKRYRLFFSFTRFLEWHHLPALVASFDRATAVEIVCLHTVIVTGHTDT